MGELTLWIQVERRAEPDMPIKTFTLAEQRELPCGAAHGQLYEARAVHAECRAARRGEPPRQIVRGLAGGADDQQFGGAEKPLDEAGRSRQALGGDRRDKYVEHRVILRPGVHPPR